MDGRLIIGMSQYYSLDDKKIRLDLIETLIEVRGLARSYGIEWGDNLPYHYHSIMNQFMNSYER